MSAFANTVSDCLVLKLQEIESNTGKIDTTIYVIYDKRNHKYLICPHNTVNEVLYNYDNLPENPNDITFGFLNDYDFEDNEISGYNDYKLKRRRLLRNLRMLRNVFNYY